MKNAFMNLLKIKSLVTLFISIVFCYLAIIGKVTGEQFLTIFTVIISFYFGTQYQKNISNGEK